MKILNNDICVNRAGKRFTRMSYIGARDECLSCVSWVYFYFFFKKEFRKL